MQRIVFLVVLFGAAILFAGCNSPESLPTPTPVAILSTPVATNTPTLELTHTRDATATRADVSPSALDTRTPTPTSTNTLTPTSTATFTPTPTATFTPSPTQTATLTATKTATIVSPEQMGLNHFLEGRTWLNATTPQDVAAHAARYFTGQALQQTIQEAQWELANGVRYKIGELTDNLWAGQSDEVILIFENTRAGKAVEYDPNWKPLNTFDVNPFSIVYVMTWDVHDKRWKVDHTQSGVDKVTGRSMLGK